MTTHTDYRWTAVLASAITVMLATGNASLAQQNFRHLANFHLLDGAFPDAAPVQGLDGNLYGTLSSNQYGGVFKITQDGTLTSLFISGSYDSYSPLVEDINGDFYGTTWGQGSFGCAPGGICGTVSKVTPAGAVTTLYSFCLQESSCMDGKNPVAGLIEAVDGDFYGTTQAGGGPLDGGTIFRITSDGLLTTLYRFCSELNCADGSTPLGGLVQATDGDFYGTTASGGAQNSGTVFKITATGTLTTIYSFCARTGCLDGSYPAAGLVQARDGDFYGTTVAGGHSACMCGTIFKVSPAGVLNTLHAFGGADGKDPSGLIQATDGNFYGTTGWGGTGCSFGCGTVFEMTAGGTLTTLYNFDATDGARPEGGLVQSTSGVFYGTTYNGGVRCVEQGCGTVYSLSLGLQPFVEALPPARKVGAPLKILGNYLAGASSVTFNGMPAEFQVISPSEIEATVPAGATSGPVEVVTPSGTLRSNEPFRVIQSAVASGARGWRLVARVSTCCWPAHGGERKIFPATVSARCQRSWLFQRGGPKKYDSAWE